MIALVSTDGRYHGHFVDVSAARQAKVVKENPAGGKTFRALSLLDWDRVATATPQQLGEESSERVALCGTLGEPL